jgi:hypothetical protein
MVPKICGKVFIEGTLIDRKYELFVDNEVIEKMSERDSLTRLCRLADGSD